MKLNCDTVSTVTTSFPRRIQLDFSLWSSKKVKAQSAAKIFSFQLVKEALVMTMNGYIQSRDAPVAASLGSGWVVQRQSYERDSGSNG